jgi:hypothetical protein
MEIERFKAIFFEVKYEVLFQEIGANLFFHNLFISLATQEHLKTVMPRHLIHTVVITKVVEIGETTPIKTYGSCISLRGTIDCL